MAAVLVVPGRSASAQADFDELYAVAEAVPAAEQEVRQRAYVAAYRAFARLPVDGAAYRAALARGAPSALQAGCDREAVRLLAALWSRDGGSGPLLTWRLTALVRVRRVRDAVDLARREYPRFEGGVHAWIRSPADGAALRGEASALLKSGSAAGLWLFETLVAAAPGDVFALANLALAYRQTGRHELSEATYRRAIGVAPGLEWLWNDLGLLHKGRGQVTAAVNAFVAGIGYEKHPGEGAGGTNLGVLFQRTGKNRARSPAADLHAVLRRRPDAALARRLLLDGLDAGDR